MAFRTENFAVPRIKPAIRVLGERQSMVNVKRHFSSAALARYTANTTALLTFVARKF
jgi:hypothetical protein